MIDNSSIVIEEEVLKTSSEMLIPNLSENLPSFLTEYNWSILLSDLYNKEYEDILYVIYKFLEKLYPDQSNYSDVLEDFELKSDIEVNSKKISNEKIYDEYGNWCSKEGEKTFAKKTFLNTIKKFIKMTGNNKNISGKQSRWIEL
jgi:hypothetical protein